MARASLKPPTSPSVLSAALGSDLEVPRNVAAETSSREIELQYLVPEKLGSLLKKGHTPVQLNTHYFPKGSRVVELALRQTGLVEILDSRDLGTLNTVRLRESIFSSGKNEYRLEFKGPKESCMLGRIERREFSFRISEEIFAEMLPGASAGVVVKLRYGIPGQIFRPDNTTVPILLELDQVLKAGAPPKQLGLGLYRADIEVPCSSLIDDIRAGRTTFAALLEQSIELSALNRDNAKPLSYSRLAMHGLSGEIKRRYQELLSRPLRLNLQN
jgi:hypothetical protein